MDTKIKIPYYIKIVLEALHNKGYKAYAVGGCIRDSIMGREPYDWDVTTSAMPEETKDCFKYYRTIDTGIKHGTVAVLVDGNIVEITTFRTENGYSDNRHPDSVSFVTDVEDDLARRDFTMNAIAYNPDEGIIDPFGGQNDIKKGIIRCVGEPERRFNEDALRIMRAIRFASVLNFRIDEETDKYIHLLKDSVLNISVERIRVELVKLLCGDNVFNILQSYSDVIFTIIPELGETYKVSQNCKYHIYDVWDHICHAVKNSPAEIKYRLTLLLHDIGKPLAKTVDDDGTEHFKKHAIYGAEISEKVLKRLRFDNKTIRTITSLVYHHDDRLYKRIDELPFYIAEYGFDLLRDLDVVSRADIKAHNMNVVGYTLDLCDTFIEKLSEYEKSGMCFKISDLDIDGNDLSEIGIKGKKIGETLELLLKKVISCEVENKKEDLINFVLKNC